MLDAVSGDYVQAVTFVGVAGHSTLDSTAAVAAQLTPSGNILWGLDEELKVWEAFGVVTQPATILINARGEIIDSWYGIRDETELRANIEKLMASG